MTIPTTPTTTPITGSTPPAASDPSAAPVLRTATAADRPAVERLLAHVGLPIVGVGDLFATHADDFVVADDPHATGEIVAVAGLEVCCDDALLRSVAVRPDWRVHGLGHALVSLVVCRAEERGLRALYLLTTTAEHYFPRFGFRRVERTDVPAEIAATVEFTRACPASAVAMAKSLRPLAS